MRLPRVILGAVTALAMAMTGAIALVPSADAAEERYPIPAGGTWEIEGRGWGHGIGLSQWGAQGAALQGRSADQILQFYYPGTQVGTAPNRTLRVGLTALVPTNTVTVWAPSGQSAITVEAVGGTSRTLQRGLLTITRDGGTYHVQRRASSSAGVEEKFALTATELRISTGDGVALAKSATATSGTWYRGSIRLAPSTQATLFDVINDVDLEAYLRGVVPREVPASWHPEALKAQTVAARSYVLAEGRRGTYFDTCDSTQCQVYGGRATVDVTGSVIQPNEHANTDRAVTQTAGQVRTYNGQVAFTQFSSTNGGFSRAGSKPYLVAKADPYTGTAPTDNRTEWTASLEVEDVARHCPPGDDLEAMVIARRDGNGPLGGRIIQIRLECSSRSVDITGTGLLTFGMFSHWWKPTNTAEPRGVVDSIAVTNGTVVARGWAFDRDITPDPIEVHMSVNGRPVTGVANLPRRDVARAHNAGENHGFELSRTISGSGPHQVCVRAIDPATGTGPRLTCETVYVNTTAPVAKVDSIAVSHGTITAKGWAFDEDVTPDPIEVHMSIDGRPVKSLANEPRPDVARAYGVGENHGYTVSSSIGAGTHQVCLRAIDPATRTGPRLACETVTVAANDYEPRGVVDSIAVTDGTVVARGWAFDRDITPDPIEVHMSVNGRPVTGVANLPRRDVARAHNAGENHGFELSRTISGSGPHQVCVRAIDPATGTGPRLTCETVYLSPTPSYERDALTSLLNDYRAANGQRRLTPDARLDSIAQNWAAWMATNATLQHNPTYRIEMGDGWQTGSEIIVRIQGGQNMAPDAIVSWMHNWWRNSPVHNENMLRSAFTHVGTGYAMGPKGPYAVHILGG